MLIPNSTKAIEISRRTTKASRAAYFALRLQNRLTEAFDLGLHSPTKVLTYTRQENEARGRLVRWNDQRR